MSFQKKAISIDERQAKSTAWALTFADVVTLLLTFFVLLLVMLNDAEKSISVEIDKLLDQTYEEMIKDLSSDKIVVDRVTKGIKITLRGNLFKSASSEIDPKYFPLVNKIGEIINESDLMHIQEIEDYQGLLRTIEKRESELNVEVRCEGHTDDASLPKGSIYPSNWELSAARSLNLVKLMNKKVKKLRVKLVKSRFGRIKKHKASIAGIGLRKINQVVEIEATPENLGMVNKINYLVEVEEI